MMAGYGWMVLVVALVGVGLQGVLAGNPEPAALELQRQHREVMNVLRNIIRVDAWPSDTPFFYPVLTDLLTTVRGLPDENKQLYSMAALELEQAGSIVLLKPADEMSAFIASYIKPESHLGKLLHLQPFHKAAASVWQLKPHKYPILRSIQSFQHRLPIDYSHNNPLVYVTEGLFRHYLIKPLPRNLQEAEGRYPDTSSGSSSSEASTSGLSGPQR
jgi:hypothetical protein